MNDLPKLNYDILGKIDENIEGIWISDCGCSGFIDENFDAVITDNCRKHKALKRIKWHI